MKTHEIAHGKWVEPRYIFDVRILAQYKQGLQIGQKVKVIKMSGDEKKPKKKILQAEIKAIYPHIAIVEYGSTQESFSIKDLMIWNMGVTA